jgi:pimeloyl-ACP methyl ester carboxylesterase
VPYLDRPDTSLYYEVNGGGPTITCIHGGLVNAVCWAPHVAALADRFRIVTYDIRGYGRSTNPSGLYSMDACVDDLLAIWDAAAIDTSVVVGFSQGGLIAQAVAARAPARVAGLVLVSTFARLPEEGRARVRREPRPSSSEGWRTSSTSTSPRPCHPVSSPSTRTSSRIIGRSRHGTILPPSAAPFSP